MPGPLCKGLAVPGPPLAKLFLYQALWTRPYLCQPLCAPGPLSVELSLYQAFQTIPSQHQTLSVPGPLCARASLCQTLSVPGPLCARSSLCQGLFMPKPSLVNRLCGGDMVSTSTPHLYHIHTTYVPHGRCHFTGISLLLTKAILR